MPELPEVETVVRTLKTLVLNYRIKDINILYSNIVEDDDELFKETLIGHKIVDIKRRGKFIIFELDNDIAFFSHLRMEGKYFVQDSHEPINKHIHVIFAFDNGLEMRYQDTRKFGRMGIIKHQEDYRDFKGLGVEPFGDDFNPDYCRNYLKNKHKPIKTLLLDQSFIAGIGNIYADEIIFKMGVSPLRNGCDLSDDNIVDLIKYTKETLALAIEAGGSTIRSYTSSLGVTGLFQLSLNVHTKEGEKCPRCNETIKKIFVGQRGTYYCSNCQK